MPAAIVYIFLIFFSRQLVHLKGDLFHTVLESLSFLSRSGEAPWNSDPLLIFFSRVWSHRLALACGLFVRQWIKHFKKCSPLALIQRVTANIFLFYRQKPGKTFPVWKNTLKKLWQTPPQPYRWVYLSHPSIACITPGWKPGGSVVQRWMDGFVRRPLAKLQTLLLCPTAHL